MSKLYNYFENLYNEDKISQAFLIGNVVFDDIKDELLEIINKFIFKSDKNINDNPDLFILTEENENINKDSIKELIMNLSTTSQFNQKKVYVIDESEKLSDKIYNALLKTLEEPPEGVYAILLTNNIDSVKPTIVSRCQKLFISQSKEKINNDNAALAENFIEFIEKENVKTIGKGYEIYNSIKDRKKLEDVYYELLYKYKDSLHKLIENDSYEDLIIQNNTIEEISKKLIVIDKAIYNLTYNQNKNLAIDRFIIEMWRCKI